MLAFAQANSGSAAGQSSAGGSQQSQSAGQAAGGSGSGQSTTQGAGSGSQRQSSSSASGASADASAGGSASKSTGQTTLGGAERKFIMHAAQGGKKEVTLGRIAAERASNPEVKAFGQMMVDDHTKANKELETLAQQKGLTLPAEKMDSSANKLSSLSGEQFDRTYISMMQADHQKDVAEFEKMSKSAQDPDVKAFAAKTLPTLQMHKDRVNALKSSTGGGSRMSSSGAGSTVTNGGNNVNNANNANRSGNNNTQGSPGSGSSSGSASTPQQQR